LLPEIVTGALLSVICAAATGQLIAPGTPLPRVVRFVTGATAFSLLVFLTLLCHAGYLCVYLAIAAALAILAWRTQAKVTAVLPSVPWFFRMVFAVAGVAYLANALAPEIQADAAGYHLRLVSDYVRLHAFSHRVGFFDALPQGMEMLFVPAFAVGAGSAAKLVHFAFLLATIPLIREIAHEAGLANVNGCAAAAFFFLAPVCAVDGTSAYTDIGLVCACCALVYLLQRWQGERSFALLVCAALNAAFCYAVKPNFGWVALAAFACLRFNAAFGGMVLLFSAPWLARSLRLRDVVTPELVKDLSMNYSAFRPSFAWRLAGLHGAGRKSGVLRAGVFAAAFSAAGDAHEAGTDSLHGGVHAGRALSGEYRGPIPDAFDGGRIGRSGFGDAGSAGDRTSGGAGSRRDL
jgi:hypothetical protein